MGGARNAAHLLCVTDCCSVGRDMSDKSRRRALERFVEPEVIDRRGRVGMGYECGGYRRGVTAVAKQCGRPLTSTHSTVFGLCRGR